MSDPSSCAPQDHSTGRLQRRLRELTRRNTALERIVADLNAFSYSVAHDLRGPLHVIAGFARSLELHERDALTVRGRERVGRIVSAALQMDRMIEEILAAARAERLELQLQPVDLAELVADLVRDALVRYPRTRVSVAALPVIQDEPALVRQAFDNLIGNALKFSAAAAQPLVEIGVESEPPNAVLFVRDNGPGFASHESESLFARFHRGLPVAAGGTGIGLSIVRRVVERHGGWVQAHSQPGGPTVFRFSFGTSRGT